MGEKPHYRSIAVALLRRGLAGAGAGALLLTGVQVVTQAPAAALPGLVRATATSAMTSVNKSQTVTCPAGRKVLGGAGRIDGAAVGEVGLTTAAPLPNGTGFKVSATEDANGAAGAWTLTAIAFCSAGPAGLQYASYTFTAGSTKSRWSSVTCPKGKQILGAGATINGGSGRALITGLVPSEDGRTVTATAYEDETGTTSSWSITATATCVNPVAGMETVQGAAAQAHDVSVASATLGCPEGTRLHGVGGEVIGGNGEVRLRHLDAIQGDQARVRAVEDTTGVADPWAVRSFAICAR
jgi:hypothetical protein